MDVTEDAIFKDVFYNSDDGLKLYARDYPGPQDSGLLPILCMHGLTRNSADFSWIASHLARSRRVISVDQRGRGRSAYDPNPANYTPLTYVNDMFTLLDHLDLPRVVVIGTSMGGLMAMIMQSLRPGRMAAVVLNDIGPELDPCGLDRIKSYVGKSREIRTWDDAVAQTREINQVAFPSFSDEEWLTFTKGLYTETDAGIPVLAYDPKIAEPIADQEENAVPPDLWPMFEQMATLPMLLIRGELSDLLAADCVRKMLAVASGLKYTQVRERGHAPMLNEPEAVESIEHFLNSLGE
ncbi:MAG: alpha/beta hydrolase [Pseudomonadota bacterium]